MKLDLVSIDLDAFADWDVFFVVISMMLAFGLVMAVRHDLRRLRITAPDPFFYPVGDVPNLPPLPQGSIIEGSILAGAAERSPAESGTGYTERELYLIERSARRAAPTGQGSGGDGNHLSGAAAASTSPLAVGDRPDLIEKMRRRRRAF